MKYTKKIFTKYPKLKQLNKTKMKNIILLSCIIFAAITGQAQTVKTDTNGNFYAAKTATKSKEAKQTGKTFTDSKGNVYPVLISDNGKFYVIRTSKAGNEYKQYLKTE